MAKELHITLLGTPSVTLDGEPVNGFVSSKAQALVYYLAASGGPHTRDALAGLLWSDVPDVTARRNLRDVLSNLRRLIGPYLHITRQRVSFAQETAYTVDTECFATLTESGSEPTDSEELASLSEAVDLYQGGFLAGFYVPDAPLFEEWALGERERLRRELEEALERLVRGHSAQGDYRSAIAYAQRWLSEDPLRESAHRALMELYARSGDRSAAVRQYEACVQILQAELGVEPTLKTTALYERIYAGELTTPVPERRERVIRGYEIRARVGEGHFGVVYRAYQPQVGREVAVKSILPQYANQPDFIRRFEAEAQIIARLEHPHIVPLYDYWREPDGAYLVMRWLRGGSLRAALERGTWKAEAAIRLVDQVAAALAAAHRQDVVHRDIKPANILLDEQGNAYLSDFGIAKDRLRTPDLTQTDAITGSPAYISPEQIQEGPVTPLADIYSLGVLLYELLTGAHPFPDQVLATLLLKHLNESLPMVAVLRPDLPPAVDEVIQRATAKDPAQRFPDAMTLADAFRQALATDAVMVSPLVGVPLPEPTNPYKGLRPFLEADAADFFGREALTDELLGRLAETKDAARFLAVVGPSGSGKSSIVRAGLVPALRRGALPGSEDWFVVQMLPGAHPLEELEAALLRVAVNPPETLLKQMRADERGLIRAVKRCLPEDSGELLLVIDQFEELFTLVEEERDRTHFLDSLQAAVTDPRSPVRLVVTLRADFYDRPLGYAGFGELTRQSTAVVLPLSPAELERAIVGPAERVGVSLEPGLVAEIVADVTEQPGGLPLLQYALTELFEGREDRTLLSEAYHAIGGVLGALGRRAEELYQGLDIKGQEAARQLFLRLITLGEGIEDTRRRVLRAELEGLTADERRSTAEGNGREDTVVSGQRSAVVQHVIELYGRYRLLTFDRDPVTRGPTVEVAHEALLREWRRLREWLDKDREFLLWHQRLRAALHQWEASERDAGALLRGAPLAEADNWLHQRLSDLTATERAFIQAGLDLREREAAEREAQRHRELEAARKLAQAEKARAEEQAYAAGRLRRRALFLAGALGAAAILAIAALFFGRQASRNEQKALAQRAIAVTEAEKRATAQAQTEIERAEAQNVALVAGSQAALANNDTDAALTLAWQAVTLNPDSALAQAQLSEVAYTPGTVRRYVGHTDGVFTLAISPDGRTLLSGSDDKTVILWNLETGEILKQLEGHTTWLNDVAFGPDGQMAASVSDEMTILWDVQTGRIIRQFDGHEGPIARIAFSPDGQNIVTGDRGDDAILIQWDVESGEILRRFEGSSRVTDIEFTPDGSAFLSASSDGILILWDFESGEIIHELNLHNENPEATVGSVRATAISPDGLTAAIGTESLGIILWDLSTGALLQSHAIPGGANTVVFHPEKDTALVGGLHYLIDVDLQTGEILNTYAGHHDSIWDVGITSNGRYAVSASFDKTLRLWELERGHVIRRFAPAGALAFEVDLSPDGRTALSGSIDGTVTLWDVETGDKIRQFTDDQPVMAVTYSPDGKTALIGTGYRLAEKVESGHVILWDVGTGEVLRQFMGHPYAVFDVEFSPDGKRAVSSGNGPVAILWDVETGQEIRRFDDYFIDSPWPTESFWDVKFSPDGSAVLASFSKGSLIMWDVETGAEIGQLVGHVDAGATGITFSEDGQRVVSGGFDSQAILWDMETRSIVRRFTNHAGPIGQVGFTPDEHLMLGGSGDGANSLWDVETGEEIRRYGNGFVVKPVFNSDGSQALVGFHDGAVELWRMDTTLDELLEWTQANRYIPELTCNQRELYRIEPLCGPAD